MPGNTTGGKPVHDLMHRTSGPNQPIHLLLDILDIVTELGHPYAIVGAMAVSFHGIPRATKDADAVVWTDPTSLKGLIDRLRAERYTVKARQGDLDDPIQQ